MEILLVESSDDGPAALAGLADEMTEDPRCRLVLTGIDNDGRATLISTWDAAVAAEVEDGLVASGWSVRRLHQS